jgi:hypothetical protein
LPDSQQFFEGLCAKTKSEIEGIEKELKAEVRTINILGARRTIGGQCLESISNNEGLDFLGTLFLTNAQQVEKDRDNWKEWPQAVLIQRWETGDFNYKHFKDTDNAKLLRQAYKTCAPDAEPRSVSRIMRVSAQVGAGW